MTVKKKITKSILKSIVDEAVPINLGSTANYIPELAHIEEDLIGLAVQPIGQKVVSYSNKELPVVTLQSVAKLIPLIGLLEDVD